MLANENHSLKSIPSNLIEKNKFRPSKWEIFNKKVIKKKYEKTLHSVSIAYTAFLNEIKLFKDFSC